MRRANRKRAVKPAVRRSLGDWLDWQSTLHPRAVDLGLERCRRVRDAMGLDAAPQSHRPPRIVVAGTNGKGSCVAFLESILTAAGLRTGAYTSPHLHRYNERVRIGGRAVSDGALVEAFERVDAARGDTSLTFFEFGTLSAADIIERARVDVAIMEVGLGGRLDAVNAFEPSVSLITAIGVDHRAWLGDDRESVGREKAGIMRTGACCVLGEREPPESVVGHAHAVGAPCRIPGRDYGFERVPDGWRWWGTGGAAIDDLPAPGLAGPHQVDNAAACLAVIDALSPRVEVSDEAARAGIASARIAGRLQWLDTPPRVLVDGRPQPPRRGGAGGLPGVEPRATDAPCRMRRPSATRMPAPCFAPSRTRSTRGTWPRCRVRAGALRGSLPKPFPRAVPSFAFDSVEAAFEAALAQRGEHEEVVVFGSFVTVQRVLHLATSAICPET